MGAAGSGGYLGCPINILIPRDFIKKELTGMLSDFIQRAGMDIIS
jgi:hypothetical protein